MTTGTIQPAIKIIKFFVTKIKGKGKGIHVQGWTGPEGFRNLRLSKFLDNRHMKVARMCDLDKAHLYPEETSPVFIYVEV